MTTPYLIAHKVRGEPAFDIAERMVCLKCKGLNCPQCNHLGYWWIIPTSGHRAYPWWSAEIMQTDEWRWWLKGGPDIIPNPMPLSLPDHYSTRTAPRQTLSDLLGYTKPQPQPLPPIKRRL